MVKAPVVDEVRTHRLVVLDDSGGTRAVIGQDPANVQRMPVRPTCFFLTTREMSGAGSRPLGTVAW